MIGPLFWIQLLTNFQKDSKTKIWWTFCSHLLHLTPKRILEKYMWFSDLIQYRELIDQNVALKQGGSINDVIETLLHSSKENYEEIIIILSRIQVYTPHSSEVERSKSAKNLIKTPRKAMFLRAPRINIYMYTSICCRFKNFTQDQQLICLLTKNNEQIIRKLLKEKQHQLNIGRAFFRQQLLKPKM